MNALDRLEIAGNTLVIFSSDNGPARASSPAELSLHYDTATGAGWGIAAAKGITGGRKGYKAALFEGGVGVPFIVRWPAKIPAGKVDDVSLISAVDLLPTFLDVAGVELPKGYVPDGMVVTDVLRGKKKLASRSKPLFWKSGAPWPPQPTKPDHWVSWAVLEGEWKLVANKDLSHVELYRISEDVKEKEDLSGAESEIVANLLALLKNWQKTLPEKPTGNVFSSERESL